MAKSMFKSLGRYRRLAFTCLLACGCFIALAVYGWGVSAREVLGYGLIALVLLAAVIVLAALAGWLLHKIKNR